MCDGNCEQCPMREHCGSGGVPEQMQQALNDIGESFSETERKILVLSGKGGVGKSTVAYLLAKSFAKNTTVGVLDLDLCGPSQHLLFHTETEGLLETSFGFEPAYAARNVSLVSSQFFLQDESTPLVARGPMKNSFVLQFLRDVNWGDVNTLIVDTPPGTSDEHLSVISFMTKAGIDGAVLVTTPEEVAISDVRREIRFCRKAGVPILGVVENMSSFTCQKCHKTSEIYPRSTGGAEALCQTEGIPLLGKVPIDPSIVAGLVGKNTPISEPLDAAIDSIRDQIIGVFPKKVTTTGE